jgi:hypothetical protein
MTKGRVATKTPLNATTSKKRKITNFNMIN